MPNAAKTPVADFFLGALSPAGFTGWFAEAAAEAGQTYLIKAGPGCGKSTLMRRLLEADAAPAGGYNERIHCSSDPASLDGAALRGAGALFLDATAPHTLDCKYPGAAERVVCLYDTLDNAGLAARRGEVLSLGARNTALLRQAAAHWALACGLLASRRALAALALDTARLDAFARRLANRTMPPHRAACPGKQAHRLLSAPTPGGLTVFTGTAAVLAPQTLYILQDADGAAAARLLGALADHAQKTATMRCSATARPKCAANSTICLSRRSGSGLSRRTPSTRCRCRAGVSGLRGLPTPRPWPPTARCAPPKSGKPPPCCKRPARCKPPPKPSTTRWKPITSAPLILKR